MGKVTVISDPGVDDLVALVLLDKLTKNQPKTLVSTFGNNRAEITSVNARNFAAFMGADWAYREGAPAPLYGEPDEAWLDSNQGSDGLWGCGPASTRPAALDKGGDPGRVISLAPLTEACRLLQGRSAKELIVMGGLFTASNERPRTELNVRLDIAAAKQVFERCKDTTVTLIPANVAESAWWTEREVRAIPETTKTNKWLKRMLLAGYENKRYGLEDNFILYDPLAIYLAFRPQAARWERRGVQVIERGEDAGCTVFSDEAPACNVAAGLERPGEVAQEIFSLLFERGGDARA